MHDPTGPGYHRGHPEWPSAPSHDPRRAYAPIPQLLEHPAGAFWVLRRVRRKRYNKKLDHVNFF